MWFSKNRGLNVVHLTWSLQLDGKPKSVFNTHKAVP